MNAINVQDDLAWEGVKVGARRGFAVYGDFSHWHCGPTRLVHRAEHLDAEVTHIHLCEANALDKFPQALKLLAFDSAEELCKELNCKPSSRVTVVLWDEIAVDNTNTNTDTETRTNTDE